MSVQCVTGMPSTAPCPAPLTSEALRNKSKGPSGGETMLGHQTMLQTSNA